MRPSREQTCGWPVAARDPERARVVSATGQSFFIAGGVLRHDVPSYVEREADRRLLSSLLLGDVCYVLTTRQMGKSSLMVRTATRLRSVGVRSAILDLSGLGQNLTPEQWYECLVLQLGSRLGIEADVIDHWKAQAGRAPLHRFLSCLRNVALPKAIESSGSAGETTATGSAPAPPALVVFIDEIDAVRSLPFPTDELFAAIRECHSRRADDPRLERLTFCILGVASPSDLIRDPRTTPFNIGHRIAITDFSGDEAAPLAAGFLSDVQESLADREGRAGTVVSLAQTAFALLREAGARKILRRVIHWTGGHPYLTQRLCLTVETRLRARKGPIGLKELLLGAGEVDLACRELFIDTAARDSDDNLIFVRERILRVDPKSGERDEAVSAILDRYSLVLRRGSIPDSDRDPLLESLKLAGIVRSENGRLSVRNRIYASVFDRRWVNDHLPDAELRRQRRAYHRGVARAAGLASLVIAALGMLSAEAIHQASVARRAQARATAAAGALRTLSEQQAELNTALRAASLQAGIQRQAAIGEKQRALDLASRAFRLERRSSEQARIARQKSIALDASLKRGDRLLGAIRTSAAANLIRIGEPFRALAELVSALGGPSNPGQDDLNRLRIGALLRYSPGVTRELRVGMAEASERISPDGSVVMVQLPSKEMRARQILSGAWLSPPVRVAPGRDTLAFSPDSTRLIVVTSDGLRGFDLERGGEVTLPIRLSTLPDRVMVSAGGKRVLLQRGDAVLGLWDLNSGANLLSLGQDIRGGAVLSPDGARLALLQGGHIEILHFAPAAKSPRGKAPPGTDTLRKYPAELQFTERVVKLQHSVESALYHLRFSPNSTRLLAVAHTGGIGRVLVWDTSTGERVGPAAGEVALRYRPSFSPDGSRVAFVDVGNRALIWDPVHERTPGVALQHRGFVSELAWSEDGAVVATTSNDRSARVWDATTGTPLTPYLPHPAPTFQPRFSADGSGLVTLDGTGLLRSWDWAAPQMPDAILGEYGNVRDASISSDGSAVATCDFDWSARIWSWRTLKALTAPLSHNGRVVDLAFDPQGRWLAVSSDDETVSIWDSRTGNRLFRLPIGGPSCALAASPDGRKVAVLRSDGRFRVWAVATGELVLANRFEPEPFGSAPLTFDSTLLFAPNSESIVGTSRNSRRVVEIRLAPGSRPRVFESEFTPVEIKYSPDGEWLAIGGAGGATVLRTSTWRAEATPINDTVVRVVRFSDDGRRLLVGADDGTVSLFDVPRWRRVGPGGQFSSAVFAAAISSDGRVAACGTDDCRVVVWDIGSGEMVAPVWNAGARIRDLRFGPGSAQEVLVRTETGVASLWRLPTETRSGKALVRSRLLNGEMSGGREGLVPIHAARTPALSHDDSKLRENPYRAFLQARADRLLSQGQNELALKSLDLQLLDFPRDMQARAMRAYLLGQKGSWEQVDSDRGWRGFGSSCILVLAARNPLRRLPGGAIRGLMLPPECHIALFLPPGATRLRLIPRADSHVPGVPTPATPRLQIERAGRTLADVAPPPGEALSELRIPLSGATMVVFKVGRKEPEGYSPWLELRDGRVEFENGRSLWLDELPIVPIGHL